MKQGDLTAPYFHTGGNPNNPLTPIKDALNGGAPFPNNQIPASRICSQSQKLLQFFPEPNLAGRLSPAQQLHRPNRREYRRSPGLRAHRLQHQCEQPPVWALWGRKTVGDLRAAVNPNPYFGQAQPKRQQNVVITYTRTVLADQAERALGFLQSRYLSERSMSISGSNFNIAQNLLIPGLTNDPFATGRTEHQHYRTHRLRHHGAEHHLG